LARVKIEGLPFRWPWVELGGAVSFALVAGWCHWDEPSWFVFSLLLLAATSTDFAFKLIPDRITGPGLLLGIASSALFPGRISHFLFHEVLLDMAGLDPGTGGAILLSCAGALLGFGLLEGFRRLVGACVGMEVFGMGDSKLLGLMGAFLGPAMILLSLVPALVAGIVFGVPYTRLARTPHLPFGPALALGGFLTLLYSRFFAGVWVALGEMARSMSPGVSLALSIVLLAIAIGLLIRVRRRRADYARRIEEDYERLEER